MGAPAAVSIERQIAAVRDELRKRRSLYPRWVEAGRMTAQEAEDRIAAMDAARATLEAVREQQRAAVEPQLF